MTGPTLRRIHPEPGELTADEAVASLRLEERAHEDRPWVVANMVVSADGQAAVGGRSGPIGGEADHALFHALRRRVDAVLAGTGTLRAERYGRLIRDPAQREARVGRGLEPEPLGCVITRSGAVPVDLPMLAEPESRVVVFSASQLDMTGWAAQVELARSDDPNRLLARALRSLRRDYGVRSLLCEGGPTLLHALVAEGLVDELFLTLSPLLVGGEPGLTALHGPALPSPVGLSLRWALEGGDELLLRYGVADQPGA